MNVKEIKPKGLFRALKGTTYEVTAALEEKEQTVNPLPALHAPLKMHDSINFAANEKIEIPARNQQPFIRKAVMIWKKR